MGNMNSYSSVCNCPNCLSENSVVLREKNDDVSIRGTVVNVTKKIRFCSKCNFEFESSSDDDWRIEAYSEYRKINNYLSPDEIKSWREKFNLTQAEVSNLLGWGASTIGRYEKGSLQSAAHDEALRSAMNSQNLAKLIDEKPEVLSEEKIRSIKEKIIPNAISEKFNDLILMVFDSDITSELNGFKEFSKIKTMAVISYICKKGGVFKTKLNKLLFYCDFLNFKIKNESITGLKYARIDFGPVPHDYELLYSYAISKNVLSTEEVIIGDNVFEKYVCGNIPFDSVFLDKEEEQIIDFVCEHFSSFTASQIVAFSHEEDAWKEVKNGKIISYKYAEKLLLPSQ